MTIEIMELIIEARVIVPVEATVVTRSVAQQKNEESRLVNLVAQRVLEKLREEKGWLQ